MDQVALRTSARNAREYFSSLNIDFDYYQSISLSSITLDKPAYDTINKCIEQVANPSDNYGLHFLSSVDNDTAASIRFFWRPLHDDKLQVLDSTITNAEVVGGRVADQEVPAGKLFPKPGWYDPFHPYAEINASGPTIQLKRINKAEPITINVTTRPQVGTAPIVIQPPEKEPTIQTFFYRETVTRTYPKSQIITPEKGPDGNIYRISDHVPGSIVSLECTYRGHTHHHQTSCGPVANRASDFKCEGFTNDGNNWPLNVTVVYLAAFLKCAENCGSAVASSVKPLPSDSPESYSYDSGFQLKGFENDTCSWSAQKH
jgi:hypothetical protein